MVEGLNVNVREALVTFKCCWLVNISLAYSSCCFFVLKSYAGFIIEYCFYDTRVTVGLQAFNFKHHKVVFFDVVVGIIVS